ncbi:glutathione gamma-glutamylcysteinyltransferase 1 [Quercus suber]|uniref:glutathione gamma-glutamylcysteinyltransferase n=1 Tax=Quercus suber TaxID=58331 RepID=A0AAW0M6Q0_QUESU
MAMAGLYRRSLPSPPAIDFASSEGKKLFIEAIQNGTMEGFYRLISNFQTQSEPAYCGLASLSMVLNALAIDPGRKWKGPWRWFDESMLDCCESLENVRTRGISFGKVVCFAHCAGAKVEAFRTSHTTIDEFRKHVITCSTSDNCHVISSYHRSALKQSCKHESWVSIAKYIMEDVPLLLKSEGVNDIQKVLSVVFSSLPSNFGEFIKWIAEVRSQEDFGQILSTEEKARVAMKEEILKQVQETGLFRQVAAFLSSANSCCRNLPPLGFEDNLPNIAATVCCQGAEIWAGKYGSLNGYCCRETCVKCLKANGDKAVTVVSGTVVNGKCQQGVDILVPSSQTKQSCSCSASSNYIGMLPASNDVLTALLLALPPETWSGIKDKKLLQEISSLVSTEKLPTLVQEEVLHLRDQLHLLKRCQENKIDENLGAPLS